MAIKPIAAVVMGNPKYISEPSIKPLAEAFYKEIQKILEARGYSVVFDPGKPYTLPTKSAVLWVGHSRGIDRLDFAPANVKTIAIQTAGVTDGKTNDEIGMDPAHYQLSNADKDELNKA